MQMPCRLPAVGLRLGDPHIRIRQILADHDAIQRGSPLCGRFGNAEFVGDFLLGQILCPPSHHLGSKSLALGSLEQIDGQVIKFISEMARMGWRQRLKASLEKKRKT